jgi:predicted AAA+ superfamily ATPase
MYIIHVMNKLNSRYVESHVAAALKAMPVVVVTGMRQAGKTTLVRDLGVGRGRHYRSLDDYGLIEQATTDPHSLIADTPVTLDEVQRAPGVLLAVKNAVDTDRRKGRYLLTGSANLLLMKSVADSLAGRAVYLELAPFCPSEWTGASTTAPSLLNSLFDTRLRITDWPATAGDWRPWLLSGGFAPAVMARSVEERDFWFSGYVQAYLERDLRDLARLSALPDMRAIMRLAALRTGRLLNQSEIARDAAVSQPTCHRYLNLLETGCQIARVPPYAANQALSLVKAPKLLWCDCGLAAWLAGIRDTAALDRRADKGFWFEQAVFQSLRTWASLNPAHRTLYYWRNRAGNEVDIVLEQDDMLVGCEIKLSRSVGPSDTKGLSAFESSLGRRRDRLVRSVVFFTGHQSRALSGSCVALSTGCLFPPFPV